ncbi:MAG: hypothetical protein ABIH92_00235 [Nanoarchaeota archaeon]
MFFKKKEDESRLPDLPPLKPYPGVKQGGGNQPESGSLPTFPDSSAQAPQEAPREKDLGETIQPPGRKDVFLHPPVKSSPVERARAAKVVEMEEWHPANPQEGAPAAPEHSELEEIEESPIPAEPTPAPQSRYFVEPPPRKMINIPVETSPADVFVRIDKFHSARRSLTEIGNRLEDIDELVKKIRETKLREEQELASWEKDIVHIKSRVQSVSENIFEKVE